MRAILSAFTRSVFAVAVLLGTCQLLGARQGATGTARVVGTLQTISGKSLTVIADSGNTTSVTVEGATKFLQIEPGKTDLKEATPVTFAELQAGDRVLVRGVLDEDGKTIRAASVIAVKKAAIAEKQARDRAEWQRGVGGLVKSVDPAALTILLTTNATSTNKEVVVHFTKDTVFRRYSSDSTRFDASRVAPPTEIHSGDQLRARGTHSEGDAEFNALEIISGTFRSIAGTVSSTDPANNTVVVQDLASRTAITLKITPESQMRNLPAQFAEGLAARLRNQSTGAGTPASAQPNAPAQTNQTPQPGAVPGATQVGRGNGGDFQQMIARMPAATISDLKKGDAVMVVTTQGNGKDPVNVITLLGGVEAILRASPKGSQDMILSPWSLGGGEPSGN